MSKKITVDFGTYDQIGEYLGNPDNEVQDKLVNGSMLLLYCDQKRHCYHLSITSLQVKNTKEGKTE